MKKKLINLLLTLCLSIFAFCFVGCEVENKEATPTALDISGESTVCVNDFSLDDYTITVTMSDGTTKELALTSEYVSKNDLALLQTTGSHTVTITYQGVSVQHTFVLTEDSFTGITFENKTVTYNGNPHSLEVVGVPSFASVSYDKATSYTNAGTYTVKATVTADNYTPLELSATLIINKATYDMSGVTYTGTTATYDGQPHTIAVSNLPDGVTASVENESCINAGAYDLTVMFSGDSQNYNPIDSATQTLTIAKRELSVTFDGEYIVYEQEQWKEFLTYNETEQKTITVQGTNIIAGDSVNIALSYSGAMVEEGSYTVTASVNHENYQLTQNNTVAVTISRATHTLTFQQAGYDDIVITVKNLENATSKIPTPKNETGYTLSWGEYDFSRITESHTFVVQRTAIPYTITYVNDGVQVENPETYTVEDSNIALNNPTNDKGMLFEGWYNENNQRVENIDTATASHITLTAKWLMFRIERAEGFEIEYAPTIPTISIIIPNVETDLTLDDKIVVSDGCALELYKPTIETTNKQPTNDLFGLQIGNNESYLVVRNAERGRSLSYKLNVYRLDIKDYTFMNGESTHHSGTIEETYTVNAPETPTREQNGVAYTFVGWSVNGEIVEFPYTVTVDTVFTAEYIPTEYTITLELAGGMLAETTLTYNFETATFALQEPTRDYYIFTGWVYNNNSITQITQGSYDDKTITATWTAIPYTIHYEMNDGTNADNPTTYTVEDEIVLKEPTREYYDFVEWQCDGQAIDTIPVGWHGEKTLTAIWTPTVYTIHYEMSNGENNADNPEEYTIEDEIVLKEPTKEYYDFVEWQYNGQAIDTIPVGWHGEKTITAIWTPHIYTVSYDFDGGIEIAQPVTSVHIEQQFPIVLNAQRTHKDNAVFDGWYLDEEYTIPAIQLTEAKDTVIYVKWIQATEGLQYSSSSVTGYTGTATEVVIAEYYDGVQITEIGEDAFYACSNITTVLLPDSTTSIGDYAFYNCSSLISIIIPDSVTTIGSYAFENCNGLTSIIIPDSVISIGDYAFSGCSLMIFAEVASKPSDWSSNGNSRCTVWNYAGKIIAENDLHYALTNDGTMTVYKYTGTATEVQIPDTVQGYSVVKINERLFYGSSLTNITIPNSVTSIGAYAFYNCSSLTSIVIPDSVTSIGSSAFRYCSSLTSVTIGNSVTSIGSSAFYNCSRLTSIVIPDSVTSIGSSAFRGCSNLTSVTFGENSHLSAIGDYAFSDCSNLTNMIIPDSVTTLGEHMFYNCTRLKNVTIGNGVTTIGRRIFSDCSRLKSVTIGEKVTTIGDGAFYDCTALTEIKFNATAMDDLSYGDYVFAYAGQSGTGITVTIGANVTKIPAYLFCPCSSSYAPNITSVVFEEGSVCTSIGSSAFEDCSSLTSVVIPDSVTSIGSVAFYNCSSLTSIVIPDSVTSIGDDAFVGCSSLTKVNYTGTIDQWAMIDFEDSGANPLYYAKKLYINDVEVTEIVLAEATEIKDYAFYNCSSLTSIVIPDSVTSIGSSAFEYCSSLTSIEIPDSVTTIGDYAFWHCSSLTSVYYGGTSEQWSAISISSSNTSLANATRYYYSENEPTLNAEGTAYDGNYWHYVDGVVTVWKKEN